ncbi:MAG: hypothetical protein IJ017_06140 [Oscillospiraceae bacterium]|nr:hypothetical protein [Oscillospiraceae bacterium]
MIKTVKVFETGSVTADIILENTPQNVVIGTEHADVGIVMPSFGGTVQGNHELLLVPQNFAHKYNAAGVVTYGMSPQSMITLSSVGEDRCVMTVQREITDIWGKTIEPQDIVISRMHLEPDAALATAAALLITCAENDFWGI